MTKGVRNSGSWWYTVLKICSRIFTSITTFFHAAFWTRLFENARLLKTVDTRSGKREKRKGALLRTVAVRALDFMSFAYVQTRRECTMSSFEIYIEYDVNVGDGDDVRWRRARGGKRDSASRACLKYTEYILTGALHRTGAPFKLGNPRPRSTAFGRCGRTNREARSPSPAPSLDRWLCIVQVDAPRSYVHRTFKSHLSNGTHMSSRF